MGVHARAGAVSPAPADELDEPEGQTLWPVASNFRAEARGDRHGVESTGRVAEPDVAEIQSWGRTLRVG